VTDQTWNPPLTTKRLNLEPQVKAHAEVLMQALEDIRTFEFVPDDPPADHEKFAARLQRLESRVSLDQNEYWLNWAVFLNLEAIGTVQASVVHQQARASIAYMFHPNFWGQGLAFEACVAMLEHLHSCGVQDFSANVDTRNKASQKLLERLGFAQKQEIKNADEFKGNASHEFVYLLQMNR
jgi:[ribosomal protein S5]-alanine N-acetyltransferase